MTLENFRNIPFRVHDLSSVYTDCSNLPMKVQRLEKNGKILRLKKGLYVSAPVTSGIVLSPFLLANHIYGPSYVSMQTALRYYGMIPEAVYTLQSMTTGLTRNYKNEIGSFHYTHVTTPYFNIGVTFGDDSGTSFLIATPEKALCDLMVYTPNLNLRFQTEIRDYLADDIRFDMDEISRLNPDIIRECAEVSRKKTMLKQLIKVITDERNI